MSNNTLLKRKCSTLDNIYSVRSYAILLLLYRSCSWRSLISATVLGTVTDGSGGVVAGAKVTLEQRQGVHGIAIRNPFTGEIYQNCMIPHNVAPDRYVDSALVQVHKDFGITETLRSRSGRCSSR